MRIPSTRISAREVAAASACAAILLWQVLLPGFIGLANNRDFAKVAGRFCIGRVDRPSAYYLYFYSDYERTSRYCWDSQISTSEIVPAAAANSIEQRLADPSHFDIRWLGAIHALAFLGGWMVLIRALRPCRNVVWWIAMVFALWIFLDVSYVAYLNTFYTDAAAIPGALMALGAALWMLTERLRIAPVMWFGFGATLFVSAKPQHAVLAVPLAIFLLVACWRTAGGGEPCWSSAF